MAFTRARVESRMQDLCMRALQAGRGQWISASSGLWCLMQGGRQGVWSGFFGGRVSFFCFFVFG